MRASAVWIALVVGCATSPAGNDPVPVGDPGEAEGGGTGSEGDDTPDDPVDTGESPTDTGDPEEEDTGEAPCDLGSLPLGEDTELRITWEGRERTYWVHVPADYDCTPRPLMVGLHFFGGEAHAAETDTLQAHDALNTRGWFGLFPQALAESPDGTWPSWNDLTSRHDTGPDGPTCTDWAYRQPAFDTCPADEADRECAWGTSCSDDVGLVRALIEQLSTDYTVDADRIFMTGFSQGGVATQGWACELGDVLTAVAPLHGFAAKGYACGPSSGVSLMQVYGYWDLFINAYDQPSADGQVYESAVETAAAWADAQGCSADPTTPYPTVSDDKYGWGCTQHAGCATGSDVVSCEWDGSHRMGRDFANGDFMMDAVWAFFEAHPRGR